VLREATADFDFTNPPFDAVTFANHLAHVMLEKQGVGLAANQLGYPYRICAVASQPVLVMFNPRIVDYSDEAVTLEEGCLSYPGLIVKVTRPKSIRIRFTYPNGMTETKKYTGMTARVIQHEVEHLDGGRFFEGVDWYEKEKVKRWIKKEKRK
jgi:peptide deformylase